MAIAEMNRQSKLTGIFVVPAKKFSARAIMQVICP
jgi:hypothetical protein